MTTLTPKEHAKSLPISNCTVVAMEVNGWSLGKGEALQWPRQLEMAQVQQVKKKNIMIPREKHTKCRLPCHRLPRISP